MMNAMNAPSVYPFPSPSSSLSKTRLDHDQGYRGKVNPRHVEVDGLIDGLIKVDETGDERGRSMDGRMDGRMD